MVNQRMCEFALARLAAMGESESGLYNYYARRAERGAMLGPEEVAIADHIEGRGLSVLELCAGAAQLGHLLSLRGHAVTAIDIDRRRCAFATALGSYIGSTCAIVHGRWQDRGIDGWELIVTLNAIGSHMSSADSDALIEYAKRGGEFIIQPSKFGSGIPIEIPGLRATQVYGDVYHYTT